MLNSKTILVILVWNIRKISCSEFNIGDTAELNCQSRKTDIQNIVSVVFFKSEVKPIYSQVFYNPTI